nr:MAG TPA: hypothetical protein [Caudoviricetes sp.]
MWRLEFRIFSTFNKNCKKNYKNLVQYFLPKLLTFGAVYGILKILKKR